MSHRARKAARQAKAKRPIWNSDTPAPQTPIQLAAMLENPPPVVEHYPPRLARESDEEWIRRSGPLVNQGELDGPVAVVEYRTLDGTAVGRSVKSMHQLKAIEEARVANEQREAQSYLTLAQQLDAGPMPEPLPLPSTARTFTLGDAVHVANEAVEALKKKFPDADVKLERNADGTVSAHLYTKAAPPTPSQPVAFQAAAAPQPITIRLEVDAKVTPQPRKLQVNYGRDGRIASATSVPDVAPVAPELPPLPDLTFRPDTSKVEGLPLPSMNGLFEKPSA